MSRQAPSGPTFTQTPFDVPGDEPEPAVAGAVAAAVAAAGAGRQPQPAQRRPALRGGQAGQQGDGAAAALLGFGV